MRDVRGYRAYQRLKRGWRLLSFAMLSVTLAPLLQGIYLWPSFQLGYSLMSVGLSLAVLGSLLAASGSFGGTFRSICLFLACNSGLLLSYQVQNEGWGGFAWLTFPLTLLAADRCLRREMGLPKGITLFPPGCILCLLVLPFFWPLAMALGGALLFLYLVAAYFYVAGALPRPQDLVRQLQHSSDPAQEAMDAITRI